MRIAAIYDIHGNLPALDAVLLEISRADVDQLIVGGDVVPGPFPRETFERLLKLDIPTRFIVGNGDRVVLAFMRGEEPLEVPERYREVIRWNAKQLGPAEKVAMASWPRALSLEVQGFGSVYFCHATPRNDTEIFTSATPDEKLAPVFREFESSTIVCGHTHMQFDRLFGKTRVINAGSVGMPFADPGAYWLLLDSDVHLKCTQYDFIAAAKVIRESSYPEGSEFAANNVLRPPTQAAMLKVFAGAELV